MVVKSCKIKYALHFSKESRNLVVFNGKKSIILKLDIAGANRLGKLLLNRSTQ